MITICIPVYNYDVRSLLNELAHQIESVSVSVEIIVIDDCSADVYKNSNKHVCKNHTYIELAENIGRAKIRNLFLAYANYDYLLFLDCDSLIKRPSFLASYVEIINEKPWVVCGGRVYEQKRPSRDKLLRWKYGVQRESQPYTVRSKFPNTSFMTNNFLIKREVLEQNRFDERITQYGHEDTLFGYVLKKRNIAITHIDNPITNGDFELNEDYLNKTREGIINLVHILNFTEGNDDLMNDITILRTYAQVKKIENLIWLPFAGMKPLLTFLLTKGFVNLVLFNFYKLGVLIEYKRNTEKSGRNEISL
jgi:glycosyltransferase involved in cell wall biosynthesis